MSLDRSLKSAGNMGGHRNVLTRAERIAKLSGDGRFHPGKNDPTNLPKVGNRKAAAKKKEKAAVEGEAAPGAAAPAGGAKPAAGAAAKPAAGAAAKPAGKK